MCDAGRKVLTDGGLTANSGLTARVPPDHTRIRKVAQSCFGPHRFKSIAPQVETIVARHLDALEAAGKAGGAVNFWDNMACHVPACVLFTLMGIPDQDVPRIKQYGASRGKMTWGDPSDEEQIAIAHDMVAHWKYIHDRLAMRRARPGGDFPSDPQRQQSKRADITDEEIAGVVYSTLFAGHETTSTFMGSYVATMMDNPAAWDAIKADPSKIPNAVEELLRYMPCVVDRRRKLVKALASEPPLPALNNPPEVIAEPFTFMLWGITSEAIDRRTGTADDSGGIKGMAAAPGAVEGIARVLRGPDQLGELQKGEILVTPVTAPSWAPVFGKIAAIVCREYGLPAVAGTGNASARITTGMRLHVGGYTGSVTILG